MTNLSQKFDELQEQMSDYQIATTAILNDILAALGPSAPPEGATLDDVLEAVNLLQVNMQSLALNQLNGNTQLVLIRGILSTISTTLSASLSTQNNILQFMLTNDWCCGDGTGDPITPPLSNEPSIDEFERCQKAQLVSDIWVALITGFDTLISQTGPTTIQQVLSVYGLNALISVSKPSSGELSTLAYNINQARSAGLSNLGGLAFSFKTQFSDLLYSVNNAQLARQTIFAWCQSHFGDPFTRDIMAYAINNALLNLVYLDGSRELDTTGYDGDACSISTISCVDVQSQGDVASIPSNGYSPRWQAVIPGTTTVSEIEYAPGLFVEYSQPVIMRTGFRGGRVYYLDGRARVVYGNEGLNNNVFALGAPGDYVEVPIGADYLIIDDFLAENQPGTGPFFIRFCAPEGD